MSETESRNSLPSGTVSTKNGLFDGFEAYRSVTDADYRNVLTRGLVVPDTNVLLNLYRYRKETRDDLFSVFRELDENMWIPHQVLEEFWRNRDNVLKDPKGANGTVSTLENNQESVIAVLRSWANRVGLPPDESKGLIGNLNDCFRDTIQRVEDLSDEEIGEQYHDTNVDPVIRELEPMLRDRVGEKFDSETLQSELKEAKSRADRKAPPGYMDWGKEANKPAGDYLIWAQTLLEAEKRKVDVLIVTGDVKDDWWRRVDGKTRGPRHELVEEMREKAGVRLFMLRPESLLLHAGSVLSVAVRSESVQEVERVDKFLADTETGGWDIKALELLLTTLQREDRNAQEAAVRKAADNGGFIARDDVYEVAGYEATRSLRGFTRPITRITQGFRQQGVISESAIDVLAAEYDTTSSNPGWASGFRVPAPLVPMLCELSRSKETSDSTGPNSVTTVLDP